MIGTLSQFWRVTRELDLNAIRADFERGATLTVLGSDLAAADRVARLIDPDALGEDLQVADLTSATRFGMDRGGRPDAFVAVISQSLDSLGRRALTELSIGEVPLLVVLEGPGADVVVVGVPDDRILTLDLTDTDAARDRLIGALVRVVPEALLPLGRRHPHVREAAAQHLIRDTARVNAQFAALSSLPSNIPLVGGIVGDAADLLVLTKNQIVLLFKLAGLYGRDLRLGRRLLAEVAPVVGGAFFWRTAARSLVGLLPGAVAMVPKVAVAYSGTYVVGEIARYYYLHGRRPPPALIRQIQADSLRLARTAMSRLGRGPGPPALGSGR